MPQQIRSLRMLSGRRASGPGEQVDVRADYRPACCDHCDIVELEGEPDVGWAICSD